MPILAIKTESAGMSGIYPTIIHIDCTDTEAEILATGYLETASKKLNVSFQEGNLAAVRYKVNATTKAAGLYEVGRTNGLWTLHTTTGSTGGPTVVGRIAHFSTTDGEISDVAADVENLGNIHAGAQGTAGSVSSYPSSGLGRMVLQAVSNTNNVATVLSNGGASALTTFHFDTGAGGAAGDLYVKSTTVTTPAPSDPLYWSHLTVGFAALATGGSEPVSAGGTAAGQSSFVREVIISFKDQFTGGGGNRDIVIVSGANTYTVITAADLANAALTGANISHRWGVNNRALPSLPVVPFPVSPGSATAPTPTGSPLVIEYFGGTTDYSAGSLEIAVCTQRYL